MDFGHVDNRNLPPWMRKALYDLEAFPEVKPYLPMIRQEVKTFWPVSPVIDMCDLWQQAMETFFKELARHRNPQLAIRHALWTMVYRSKGLSEYENRKRPRVLKAYCDGVQRLSREPTIEE